MRDDSNALFLFTVEARDSLLSRILVIWQLSDSPVKNKPR